MQKTMAKRITRTIVVGQVDTSEGIKRCTVDVALAYHVAMGTERTTDLQIVPKGEVYPVLSITGHTHYSSGQCQTEISDLLHSGRLKKASLLTKMILGLWNDWHLNDMSAGCVHQREAGWGPELCGDACATCGYEWGSAWLLRRLPVEIERKAEFLILEAQ